MVSICCGKACATFIDSLRLTVDYDLNSMYYLELIIHKLCPVDNGGYLPHLLYYVNILKTDYFSSRCRM